jgi:ATP-dependent Zn protease
MRVAGLAVLLVVLSLGLLYAYRSQTPSVPDVSITQALQDIGAGRVKAVTIAGNRATLEFRDSAAHREQTTLPQPDTVLLPTIAQYNAANPSQAIDVRFVQDSQPLGVVGSIVLSLLPVLLIGGFFYYLMGVRRKP